MLEICKLNCDLIKSNYIELSFDTEDNIVTVRQSEFWDDICAETEGFTYLNKQDAIKMAKAILKVCGE